MRVGPHRLGVIVTALTALVLPAIAQGDDASMLNELLDEIRDAGLEPERAVFLQNVEIPASPATAELVEGLLIPASPVAGSTHEAVFLGRARFRFEYDDPVETRQLEWFVRGPSIDAEIDKLVLTTGSPQLLDSLIERGRRAAPSRHQRRIAESLFAHWTSKEVRRTFGMEAAILRSHVQATPEGRFLAFWCHSESPGNFFFRLDPWATDQIWLGSLDVRDDERFREKRDVLDQIWVHAPLRDPAGEPRPGKPGFEATHYELEITVPPTAPSDWAAERDAINERIRKRRPVRYFHPGRGIEGNATITIVPGAAGRRFVNVQLDPSLWISEVTAEDGTPLFWFRSWSNAYVVLPSIPDPGETPRLRVTFGGEIFDELVHDNCRLRSTVLWHPRVGEVHRATYDMTFHWPEGLELLAGGYVTEDGVRDGMRWAHRVLPIPVLGTSFEFGEFDIREETVGRFTITVAFSRIEVVHNAVRDNVVQLVKACMLYYETMFGPYPMDRITVVSVRRRSAQGFLGFVTLAHDVLVRPRNTVSYGYVDDRRSMEDIRAELVAHELSHQWWGNKVGWAGYRDQWLSEALADYSALQFLTEIGASRTVALAQRGRTWRAELLSRTPTGHVTEELGPVVLGTRLAENHGGGAYSAIVYSKGSVIFSMLAQLLGPEPFNRMLGALADAVDNRVISTETFLRSIEHMSGADLDGFARRFIYDTGIPEMFYDYRIAPANSGWTIEGSVTQLVGPEFRHELRYGEGRWRVRREVFGTGHVDDLPIVVPFQVALEESADPERTSIVGPTESGLGGTLVVRGATSRFSIPVPREPRRLWLDQRGEVLATFYSAAERPKRHQRRLGEERLARHEYDEAERAFREALEAPLFGPGARPAGFDDKRLADEARLQDASTHLGLARLHLDDQRPADARTALENAESLLAEDDKFADRERAVLGARLELLEEDFGAAYRRMKAYLLPQVSDVFDAELSRRLAWLRQDAESFVVLAVAAHETGHAKLAELAAEAAEQRGADVNALRERF